MSESKEEKKIISLTNRVKLIMVKVEIIKLKAKDNGYDWWHLEDTDRNMLEDTVKNINELLKET